MNFRLLSTCLAAITLATTFVQGQTATTAAATTTNPPIAVYSLGFDETGDSVNFKPFDAGYYIAPVQGGTGTLILTVTKGGKKYFTYANFGEIFVSTQGSKTEKMVLSAVSSNAVASTSFYAIGTSNFDLPVVVSTTQPESRMQVAKVMRGYCLTADSESDVNFRGVTGASVGVAGSSIMTARLDENSTQVVISKNDTLAQAVTYVTTLLQQTGFANGTVATTTTTGTTTGN